MTNTRLPSERLKREQRWEEVYALREAGWTYKEIGSRFGFCVERARCIYKEAQRERQLLRDGHLFAARLSARSRGCLVRHFQDESVLFDPERVVRLGKKGALWIKNLGRKSVFEISQALHDLGYVDDPDAW